MITIDILAWCAIVLIAVGYWLQVWKIHVHREVRDISLPYTICLVVGFVILGALAIAEGSTLFLIKQVASVIPVAVIVFQVIYHRKDRWHDPRLPHCDNCNQEVELHWTFCPKCGIDQASG